MPDPILADTGMNADWAKLRLDVSLRDGRTAWHARLAAMPEREFTSFAMTRTGIALAESYDWFRALILQVGSERGVVPTLPPSATVDGMDVRASLVAAAAERAAGAPRPYSTWTSAGIAFLNTRTGDGRALAGEIGWNPPPLPLMAQLDDAHGGIPTMTSKMAGGIDSISLVDDAFTATGSLDDTEIGRATHQALATGRYGVSIDLAVHEWEEVLDGEKYGWLFEPWDEIESEPIVDESEDVEETSVSKEAGLAEEGDIVLAESVEDDLFVVTKGSIMGATVVPFPAFNAPRKATIEPTLVAALANESGGPVMVRVFQPLLPLVLERRPVVASMSVAAAAPLVNVGQAVYDTTSGRLTMGGGSDAQG